MSQSTTADTTSAMPHIGGHPEALFYLFFTEMWERFSYYGMRALLVLFLVSETARGGWAWSRSDALSLYGWYTSLVYLTPILGGYLSDRFLDSRRGVALGGVIIAAGHGLMLWHSLWSFYTGLMLIVLGTGFFKPNINAIVGRLYASHEDKKREAGYTLFYMGVNAGAFFGISVCGYVGEKFDWRWGFALAGVFMLCGVLQFVSYRLPPSAYVRTKKSDSVVTETQREIVRDRLFVVGVLSLLSIFFWFAFEQAGGTMTIFAASYTERMLTAESALMFKLVSSAMLMIPALILSLLIWRMWRSQRGRVRFSPCVLVLCMTLIWLFLCVMCGHEFAQSESEIPASWFASLGSFFVVVLAPAVSLLWDNYWNPDGPTKFAIGLLLLAAGFVVLAFGARTVPLGAQTGFASIWILICAYFLHALGELYVSPVGLSFVSKLVPSHLLGLMFGLWFLNTAIANKLAGHFGSYIDHISSSFSLSIFFMILALVPASAAMLSLVLRPYLLRKMHFESEV